MKSTIKPGIALGLIVVVWMYIIGFAGWYKDPAMLNMFYMVIVFQIVVLVWGLRLTAAEGKAYGSQIAAGMVISLIGAVIIFVGSYLFTTVAFPRYFEEIHTVGERVLREQGKSEEEIRNMMKLSAPMQTPLMNAITGVVGTLMTGVLASAIIAFFVRKK